MGCYQCPDCQSLPDSTYPLAFTPLVTSQLQAQVFYWRQRLSTDFSFSQFLVLYLIECKGRGFFMKYHMLCRGDNSKPWQ